MLQDVHGDVADIGSLGRDAAIEQRERLGAKHQVLRGARAGAPFHVILHDLRCAEFAGRVAAASDTA